MHAYGAGIAAAESSEICTLYISSDPSGVRMLISSGPPSMTMLGAVVPGGHRHGERCGAVPGEPGVWMAAGQVPPHHSIGSLKEGLKHRGMRRVVPCAGLRPDGRLQDDPGHISHLWVRCIDRVLGSVVFRGLAHLGDGDVQRQLRQETRLFHLGLGTARPGLCLDHHEKAGHKQQQQCYHAQNQHERDAATASPLTQSEKFHRQTRPTLGWPDMSRYEANLVVRSPGSRLDITFSSSIASHER